MLCTARTMLPHMTFVRPFVRLYVTRRYCVETRTRTCSVVNCDLADTTVRWLLSLTPETSLLDSCSKACISLRKFILDLFHPHVVHCCVCQLFNKDVMDGWMDGSWMETAKHIKRFSSSDSYTILFFQHQTLWQYSDLDPITGRSNARGTKSSDFRPISRFISELIQDRAIVTMEFEYETVPKLSKSNGTIFNDLEWPCVILSEIFNDTKHRAVSLRQLNFCSPVT